MAANAVIREPLTLSVIMDAPMRAAKGQDAFAIKQAIFSSLKATLDYHNNAGGTYTVVTPAYMYQNLIMVSLMDNSRGNTSLPQNAWRFDFEKPLVALADLATAQNQLMSKISNQVPTNANQTGIQPGVQTGQTPLDPQTPFPATFAPDGSTFLINPATSPAGMTTGGAPSLAVDSGETFGFPSVLTSGLAFGGIS